MEENNEKDFKDFLDVRVFLDYLLPVLSSVLERMSYIIIKLDRETYYDRIKRTEEKRGKKTVTVNSITPLDIQDIHKAIEETHLGFTLKRLKDMLISVSYLTVKPDEVVEIMRTLPDKEIFSFEKLVSFDDDVLSKIHELLLATSQLHGLGYGRIDKYIQVFYLVVKRSIQLIESLGY